MATKLLVRSPKPCRGSISVEVSLYTCLSPVRVYITTVLTLINVYTSHQKVVLEVDFTGKLWVRRHPHPSPRLLLPLSSTGLHRDYGSSYKQEPQDDSSACSPVWFVLSPRPLIVQNTTYSLHTHRHSQRHCRLSPCGLRPLGSDRKPHRVRRDRCSPSS